MIEGRLDLAVRRGPITDASLVSRVIGRWSRVAVASPAYLERRGAPRTPADLAEHDCILHYGAFSGSWRFGGPDGPFEVPVAGRFGADSSQALHSAALGGQGIALLWKALVIDDLCAGRLLRVLGDYPSPEDEAIIVYPSRQHLPPRTRVVIDFVVEQVRELEHQNGASQRSAVAEHAWLV